MEVNFNALVNNPLREVYRRVRTKFESIAADCNKNKYLRLKNLKIFQVIGYQILTKIFSTEIISETQLVIINDMATLENCRESSCLTDTISHTSNRSEKDADRY